MQRDESEAGREYRDRQASDADAGPVARVVTRWVAPVSFTVVLLALLLRRSGDGFVFSRWSGQAALAILGFAALVAGQWWISLRSSRRTRFESTLSRLTLARVAALSVVLAIPLGAVGYAGGIHGALMLLPVLLLLTALCMSTERPRRTGALVVFSTLIVLIPCEAFLLCVRHSPRVASIGPVRGLAHGLYSLDRNLIQYQPGAARHDAELGYSFVPGSKLIFRDTEFENEFRLNRLGLRDDEESLDGPEIIVIGDSFAMGWGVEQEETFASLVEQRTGRRTLNAGVSSYGTARELMLLERLDLSRAKYLVIQYCDNDYRENLAFAENGDELRTMSEETFRDAVTSHADFKRYFPFRYMWKTLALERRIVALANAIRPSAEHEASQEAVRTDFPVDEHVEMFLNALVHAPVDLSGLSIIVLELNPRNARDAFIPILAERALSAEYPQHIRSLKTLDIAEKLAPDAWFEIDDHIDAGGHALVAEAIARVVASE